MAEKFAEQLTGANPATRAWSTSPFPSAVADPSLHGKTVPAT